MKKAILILLTIMAFTACKKEPIQPQPIDKAKQDSIQKALRDRLIMK